MKATVNRKELLSALAKVGPAVPRKATLPIITSVLVEAGCGKVKITASNLEQALITSLDAEVDAKGSVCTYPKLLADALKALKCEKVTLKTNEVLLKTEGTDKLIICTESGKTIITGFDPADFPPVPVVKTKPVAIEGLVHALGMVSDCMAVDDCRPVLHGVHLCQVSRRRTEVVAADGFRLAIHAVKAREKLASCMLPSEAVLITCKLKSEVSSIAVEVREDGAGTAMLDMGAVTLVTQLISGTYPDYSKLVPKREGAKRMTVDVAELQQALQSVAVIKPVSDIVRLASKGKKLTLSTRNDDDVSTATIVASGSIKIAMNYIYLRDILKHFQGKVTLYTHEVGSPILISRDDFTYMVMPMFVQWGDKPVEA